MSFSPIYNGINRYDFPLHVWNEATNDLYASELCADIYYVALNKAISVALIPSIEEWPPTFPPNDETAENVRKAVLLEQRYAISPRRTATAEALVLEADYVSQQLELPALNEQCRVITFPVSPKIFEQFCNEAKMLQSEIDLQSPDNTIENLKTRFALLQFIDATIIKSPYLSDRELQVIKRRRLSDGTVHKAPQ